MLFGYDVEKLEIRLHETYDLVDVFVIQESSVTMFMYPKPVLLPTLLTDPRFAPFLDKIVPIHVSKDELPEGINGDAVDHWFRNSIVQKFFALESTGNPLVAKVVSALRAHGLSGSIDNNDEDTSYSAWFWKSIVRIFYALVSMGSPLAAEGVSSLSGSYPIGLQNDADEVVSYSALSHVKHCELRPEIDEYGVQFPSFSFKKNFHWVQETYDMQCLQGSSFQSNSSMILKAYMWRPGPFAWPLYKMNVHADNLLRVYDMSDAYCTLNMGLGAAVHVSIVQTHFTLYLCILTTLQMSSVAEPAEVWMKRVGTQDGIGLRLQPAFLRAARAGAVTPELIFLETMYPSCVGGEAKFQHFHIGSMGSHVEAKVMSHLPLVVRKHPGRYPFLLPGHPVNAKRHKLIKQASEVRWKENMCSLPSAKELLYTTSLTS